MNWPYHLLPLPLLLNCLLLYLHSKIKKVKYKQPTSHPQSLLLAVDGVKRRNGVGWGKRSKIKTFEITNKFSEINFSSLSILLSKWALKWKRKWRWRRFYHLPVPHYFYHCFMQMWNNQNKKQQKCDDEENANNNQQREREREGKEVCRVRERN